MMSLSLILHLLRRRLAGEAGQTSVEWLALGAFIVAILASVVALAPDVASAIGDVAKKVINAVSP